MVIFYFTGNIIGRGSGRSSVGAAAYRSGEKLHAVGAAAYRSGEELRDEDAEMTHNYTKKGGIAYSEIMLPDDAPPKYADRETLWNAVEASERRKNSQLAREIIVALQREFDAQEQLEVLREYIEENFVSKGMIADFSIHNKGDGNPHAHIMLTTRHVSPDGFGLKNRDWNNKNLFVEWRKNWADVNNRKFEEKGLEERISHLSLEAQGIDREPTIHLGAHASALEKRGIRTKRGDINREIERRNAERAAQKEAEKAELEQDKTENASNININNEDIATKENAVDEHTIEKTAEHLNKLKEYYTTLEKELTALIASRNQDRQEIPRLTFRAEEIDEHAKNIEILQEKVEELQESRQNLKLLQWIKRSKADKEIMKAEQEAQQARDFFKNEYHIDPSEAPDEIKRIQKTVREKEDGISVKNAAILGIMDTQDKVLLGYHTQKLLAETEYDKDQLNKLLKQMNKPPETVRERLQQEQIDRRLNIIPDEDFQKVIEKLPPEYAQPLIKTREQTKADEREQEKTREQSRTIERSR
ncbi:MAG: MobA/MobL family protein [Nitrososphaerota archaeon]|nr:MobA/MobL family protein [Nitrososphaerota archaeon]